MAKRDSLNATDGDTKNRKVVADKKKVEKNGEPAMPHLLVSGDELLERYSGLVAPEDG